MSFAKGDNNQVGKVLKAKQICSGLQDENKRARMQTVENLHNYLKEDHFTQEDYHAVYNEIHIYALNGLRDPSEATREKSVAFWRFLLIEKLPPNDYYLTYIFPILTERIGTCELVEESEEIVLQLVQFLKDIIEKYTGLPCLKPFLNEIVTILSETVRDKFPDVKVTSCKCITALAKALPRDFHLQAETLVLPVLTCFKHQRNLVRSEAIMCMGDILMECSFKGVDQAMGALGERLLDSVSSVRRSIGIVASRWLLEHKDRYSYFAKMLPLLLTLLNDETPSIQEEMLANWEAIGLQYMKENENDLKDQMDFLLEAPKYYPNVKRPNLGCRSVVARNIGKLCKALSNELLSWQDDVREKCSELLYILILHAEDNVTQHVQGLLPAMYVAARNEKRRVVLDRIIASGQLIGTFVSTDSWKKLVLPIIEDGAHCGNLIVLRALLEGTPKEYLYTHLNDIIKILADSSICRIRKLETQKALLDCILSLLTFHGYEYPTETAQNIFIIYISVLSLRSVDLQIDSTLLEKLCANMGMKTTSEVWIAYTTKLLGIVGRDPKSWVLVTPERCILETILLQSGAALGQNLDTIGNILVECLDADADPESRLKIFNALTVAFDKKSEFFADAKDLPLFLQQIVSDVIAHSLVWSAGRSAESIRTIAALCLYSALKTSCDVDLFASPDLLKSMYSKFLPLLISLSEDASFRSRQLAVQNLALLKELCADKNVWYIDDLVKIYPEMMKRLDDPIEKVREWAIKALGIIMESPPDEFKKNTYKAHHELIIDALLTHLDDTDEKYHNVFTDMLKNFATISNEILKEKITQQRPLLRNQSDCDEIMKHLNALVM